MLFLKITFCALLFLIGYRWQCVRGHCTCAELRGRWVKGEKQLHQSNFGMPSNSVGKVLGHQWLSRWLKVAREKFNDWHPAVVEHDCAEINSSQIWCLCTNARAVWSRTYLSVWAQSPGNIENAGVVSSGPLVYGDLGSKLGEGLHVANGHDEK